MIRGQSKIAIQRVGSNLEIILSSGHLVTLSLLAFFLAIYIRTAAPSVLSGDSAEFQLAAPLLGVPHPTTYPLYVLLGKLATLLVPFGDAAWRVTLVSAGWAALAVGLWFVLARRLTGSTGAAAVAALALGLAPGLWNAATIAEVYAPLAALLAALGCLLATNDHRPMTSEGGPTTDKETRRQGDKETRKPKLNTQHSTLKTPNHGQRTTDDGHPLTRSPAHPLDRELAGWRLRAAAFVAGLGCTHHGLFVLTGLPLFVGYILWRLARSATVAETRGQGDKETGESPICRRTTNDVKAQYIVPPRTTNDETETQHSTLNTQNSGFRQLVILGVCFAAGLAPWLYPLIQYTRYGPFDGADYGLPRHYFWGAPRSWGELANLLSGRALSGDIFRAPSPETAMATLGMVGERLWFEFGPLGVPLGVLGCGLLARQSRLAWAGAAWVFLATLAYLLLLGPAVQDAPTFSLPMLLPWSLWIAAAVRFILGRPTTNDQRPTTSEGRRQGDKETRRQGDDESGTQHSTLNTQHFSSIFYPLSSILYPRRSAVVLGLLVAATLAWGYTRVPYASKRRLWLFREFGQATLAGLPPRAAVITHWEQGTTLQYLRMVEGLRPDVWVDVVEPSDEAWGERAARRYAGRPVYFVGHPPDVADLPVELTLRAEYADLYRLRAETGLQASCESLDKARRATFSLYSFGCQLSVISRQY
jgi:hypothetical protein